MILGLIFLFQTIAFIINGSNIIICSLYFIICLITVGMLFNGLYSDIKKYKKEVL